MSYLQPPADGAAHDALMINFTGIGEGTSTDSPTSAIVFALGILIGIAFAASRH